MIQALSAILELIAGLLGQPSAADAQAIVEKAVQALSGDGWRGYVLTEPISLTDATSLSAVVDQWPAAPSGLSAIYADAVRHSESCDAVVPSPSAVLPQVESLLFKRRFFWWFPGVADYSTPRMPSKLVEKHRDYATRWAAAADRVEQLRSVGASPSAIGVAEAIEGTIWQHWTLRGQRQLVAVAQQILRAETTGEAVAWYDAETEFISMGGLAAVQLGRPAPSLINSLGELRWHPHAPEGGASDLEWSITAVERPWLDDRVLHILTWQWLRGSPWASTDAGAKLVNLVEFVVLLRSRVLQADPFVIGAIGRAPALPRRCGLEISNGQNTPGAPHRRAGVLGWLRNRAY